MIDEVGSWFGIRTSNQLIAFSTTVTMMVTVATLALLFWDRTERPLWWRRWLARRRMDAVCDIYYSQTTIDAVTRNREQSYPADLTILQIIGRDMDLRLKEGQWIKVSSSQCEVRPSGHEQVDPRGLGRTPAIASAGQGKMQSTDLLWEIRLPAEFPIDKRAIIHSGGRRFFIDAVVNRHSGTDVTKVVARSLE